MNATAPPDPVAALVVSENRVLHRTLVALAASAGVRIRVLEELPSGEAVHNLQSDTSPALPPLVVFDSDTAHYAARVSGRARAIHVTLSGERAASPAGLSVINLPSDEPRLLRLLIQAANRVCKQASVIEVRGVTGGAGATTTAIMLAGASARMNHASTLIESGRCPPSLALALGLESKMTLGWDSLVDHSGTLTDLPHPEALYMALPRWRSARVLARLPATSPPRDDAVSDVIAILARQRGIVIVDGGTQVPGAAPPDLGAGDPVVVYVVPRTVGAVVQAHEIVVKATKVKPVLITRDVGGSLTQRDVEKALPLPVLGQLPHIGRLQGITDRGLGLPGAGTRYWKTADAFLSAILSYENSARATLKPNKRRLKPARRI